MTPAEHYAIAEELVERAAAVAASQDAARGGLIADELIALAQVHATLSTATEASRLAANDAYWGRTPE
jgi:hypothetical protein